MKYPFESENIIDVTKAPYFADNTGKTDCTEVLCRIFDDLLSREREGVEQTRRDLLEKSNNGEKNIFIGFEARTKKGFTYVIFPEVTPPARMIYFPNGEYLVSDTVSYRAKDLFNIYKSQPFYTLTRGIHIMGESREGTVIRLADHSDGFEAGKCKPVLAFTMDERACEVERSNVSQMNTCEDLTIDCGANPGAVGLRFVANNAGRVENISLKAKEASVGLELAVGTEGVFRNITAEGFEIGVRTRMSSICVYDRLSFDVKTCGVLARGCKGIFRKCASGNAPFLDYGTEESRTDPKSHGTYCFMGNAEPFADDPMGNRFYFSAEPQALDIPRYEAPLDAASCACVDDFGAVGDGVTDCAPYIQKALDSGKPYIFFGSGHYLVNSPVHVPASVKLIDFMFCDLFAGEALQRGDFGAFLVVDGETTEPLCLERLYAFEQFCGHFRFIEHACKRELRMRDLHTQATAMYYNTVAGGRVYTDNCVCTTGSYFMSISLARHGMVDDYYNEIPFEFHGQRVLSYNLNPERARLEVLNDASDLTVYGLKTEGPGTAIQTINGGVTRVFNNSSAIGSDQSTLPLFADDKASKTEVYGGLAFGIGQDPSLEFRRIYAKEGAPDLIRGEGNPFLFDLNAE